MTRFVPPSLAAWVIAGLLVLSSQSTAHAGRGFFLITHGQAIKHVGDVVEDAKPSLQREIGHAGDVEVAFLHERIGLFYVDVWTWDGEFVLYDRNADQLVSALHEEQAALLTGAASGKVGKPIFYTIPPGLVIVGLLGAGWAYSTRRQSQQARLQGAELEEAANDPRYQRALGFLQEYHRQRIATAAAAADGAPLRQTQPRPDMIPPPTRPRSTAPCKWSPSKAFPRDEAERRLWMLWATKQTAPA